MTKSHLTLIQGGLEDEAQEDVPARAEDLALRLARSYTTYMTEQGHAGVSVTDASLVVTEDNVGEFWMRLAKYLLKVTR